MPSTVEIVIGIVVIGVLSILAVKVRTIDVSGTIAGAVICFATLVAGGLGWLSIIIVFVLVSSVLTRYRYDYKLSIGSAQEKGGTRSWPNTLANGLVGGFAAIAEILTHQEIYAVVYVAAIAAAMSDTIATEIGLLSNSRPRLIFDPRKVVAPGTSGGISGLGELAGLSPAIGIGGLGVALKVISGTNLEAVYSLLAVIIAAFAAMNLDSLMGATVQGKNKCKVCGISTENLYHHDQPTITERGVRFLDNNIVNLISTVAAALIAAAIYLVLVP